MRRRSALWKGSCRPILGKRRGLTFDPELFYTAAMFHDLGLTAGFRESRLRFEVDGANAARDFLRSHGISEVDIERVWLAIALTEVGHEGEVYRITGPEALTYQEVAEILSEAIGKKVRYDNSLENYSRFLKNIGLDVDEVLELDACVAKGVGDGSAVTSTIFQLTKRQPIRFAQFANDHSRLF